MTDKARMLLGVAILTLVGLGIRLVALGNQSLWLDEVNTYQIVAPGWSGLGARGATLTSSPPLFYGLVRIFFSFSADEFGLRLSSAICGALTIPILFIFCLESFKRDISFMASILLSVSPFHVWFSQDARPYALFMLLSLLSTYFFVRIMKARRLYLYFFYALTLSLCLYVHILTALVMIFQFSYWLIYPKKERPKFSSIIGIFLVVVLSFLPFLPTFIKGLQAAPGIPREFSILTIPYTFYAVLAGFSFGPTTYSLHNFSFESAVKPFFMQYLMLSAAFLPSGVAGLLALRRSPRVLLFLTLWVLIPVVGLATLSMTTHHAYNVRYISYVVLPMIIILAVGVFRGMPKNLRGLALFLILLCDSISLWNHFEDPRYSKCDFRSLGRFLEEECEDDDAVYLVSFMRPFEHYYSGGNEVVRIPLGSDSRSSKVAVQASLEDLASRASRIWLVEGRWEQLDPGRSAREFCEKTFVRIDTGSDCRFPRLEVTCFATGISEDSKPPRVR